MLESIRLALANADLDTRGYGLRDDAYLTPNEDGTVTLWLDSPIAPTHMSEHTYTPGTF